MSWKALLSVSSSLLLLLLLLLLSCIEKVFVWQDDLPERFAALIADPPTDLRACRTKALIWMPVRELARYPTPPLHACASSQQCGMLVHFHSSVVCLCNLMAACATSQQCSMLVLVFRQGNVACLCILNAACTTSRLVHCHSCLCNLTAMWHACACACAPSWQCVMLVQPHSNVICMCILIAACATS